MQKGGDADSQITNVSLPGSQVGVCKRQPKRAKRPHSKFSDCKTLDGPAMRPRKLRLPWRMASGSWQPIWRPMSAREREHGELPSPELSLLDLKKLSRDFLFFLQASFTSQFSNRETRAARKRHRIAARRRSCSSPAVGGLSLRLWPAASRR